MMTTAGVQYEAIHIGGKYVSASGRSQTVSYQDFHYGDKWPMEKPFFDITSGIPTSTLFIDWNIRYVVPINKYEFSGNPETTLVSRIQFIVNDGYLSNTVNNIERAQAILNAVEDYDVRCKIRNQTTKQLPRFFEYDETKKVEISPISEASFNNLLAVRPSMLRQVRKRPPNTNPFSMKEHIKRTVDATLREESMSLWDTPMMPPPRVELRHNMCTEGVVSP